MDASRLIVVVTPITILIALFTAVALPFVAGSRFGRGRAGATRASAGARKRTDASGSKAWPLRSGTNAAAPAGYLYVPCTHAPCDGSSAGTRRWVQEVPIVKKTPKWIYYTSETWDRREAVVSPGCISREEFETDTRCRDTCPRDIAGPVCARHGYTWAHCLHGEVWCRRGYPAGVIPIPGDRPRPGPAGRLFFATRRTAEAGLYRGERERAGPAAPQAPCLKELRRVMADAHPDRGGTAEQFIQARHRYQTALASTSRSGRPFTSAEGPSRHQGAH